MKNLKITELYDLTHTLANDYLRQFIYPWEALKEIRSFIISLGKTLNLNEYDYFNENIWIHKTAKVFSSAYLGSPCIIGKNTEVLHCAFIKESALVGENCIVGNSVEFKNVIIFDEVKIAHYNYIGDSIIGYKSHMGAGSVTSNIKADKKNVVIKYYNKQLETGIKKIGAMIGDYVEVGCNSVLNPGTIICRNCNIYPMSCVRGVIQEESIWKTNGCVVKKGS